ncbi:MAG TPA: hypothetical protein VF828_01585 [Patescibacteria group bacterium]
MIKDLKNKVAMAGLFVPVAHAADSISIVPKGQFGVLGDLTVGGIISGAVSLVMLVVALVFFFILILGGLRWVTSEGDQKNVEAARNQITNALIGLAIVFAAWAIIKLIGAIFNIDILNFTIPTFY